MKRFLLWTTGVLLVIAAALAIVLSQIDTAFVVRQIADATAKATGKPLVFENAPQISFFPPGVRFGQARWGQSDQGDTLAISVKGGMAELEFMPLLSGTMVVREVRLDNPVVMMRQSETASAADDKADDVNSDEGETAVASPASADISKDTPKATPKDAAKTVSASPNQATANAQAPAIELKRLVVRQGSLHFTDGRGQTLDLSDLNLSVENLRPGQEAVAQCDFTFTANLVDKEKDSKAKASTPLSGNLALSAKLRYAPPQLALRQTSLTLSPLSGPLPKEAGPMQLNIEGNADLNTLSMHVAKCWLTTPQARLGLQGEASFSPIAFTGNLELDGSLRKLAALAGQTLKPAPKGISDDLKIKSRLAYGNNSLNLSDISARVDDIDLRGQLRLGMEPKTPLSITAEAQISAINLDNYLPLPESDKNQTANDSKDKKTAEDASSLPDINVRAAVAGIRQGKLQIKDVQVIAQGLRGNYKISTFNCVLGSGGTVRAAGAANIPASAYAVNGTASDVNLGALLESLGKGRPVSGLARLDVDLTMSGKNTTALQNSLSGKGELEVRQMHLESMPALPANVPGITGKPLPDTFDLVRVPFTAKNGEINASPITVSSSGLNARGQAKISLPRQNVEATANVETLGMTVPVIVKGPFSNISYSVDPRFALDIAKKLPGLLQDTGKNAGDSAKGAGTLLQNGARGAEGLVRGLFGK
ncbi:MAG: AsmA family protein [Desulfovibrio sp.]|uniref:AsmA family protein n=1 Tax=Desulfovibrio sp. TaxID=885 RepID=UPI0039E23C8E